MNKKVASNRIDRISHEYMRAMAEAMRTLKDPRVQGLVSITRCEVTGDLRYAKIYVSVLGDPEAGRQAMRGLQSAAGFLRREVGQKVDLRAAPEPVFHLDDSIRRGTALIASLQNLKIPEADAAQSAEAPGRDDDKNGVR